MSFFPLNYKMLVLFQKENRFVFEREEGIIFCLDVLARKKNSSLC